MLKEVKGESVTEVPIMLVGNKKDEDQVIQLLFFPLEWFWKKDSLYFLFV